MNGSDYCQEKLTIFVADDKIWISMLKLEFWKALYYHHKFYNFPIVENFSDEIGGDINEIFLCVV